MTLNEMNKVQIFANFAAIDLCSKIYSTLPKYLLPTWSILILDSAVVMGASKMILTCLALTGAYIMRI